MSQDTHNDLITRILAHCQQVAQDALDPHLRWSTGHSPRDPYERWYVHSHKSFIALKKKHPGQMPWITFPPATEKQILKTERQLGFALPLLLRLLYTHVANGGFGPGYGIIGAIGGFSFTGSGGKTSSRDIVGILMDANWFIWMTMKCSPGRNISSNGVLGKQQKEGQADHLSRLKDPLMRKKKRRSPAFMSCHMRSGLKGL
jgi:hypothetical protein